MKIPIISSSLIALSVLLIGCATIGTEMDMEKMESIQRGVTTRTELEESFGAPSSVGFMEDKRYAVWTYSEAKSTVRNFIPIVGAFTQKTNTRVQELKVIFDENDIVVDYIFNESSKPIQTGIL